MIDISTDSFIYVVVFVCILLIVAITLSSLVIFTTNHDPAYTLSFGGNLLTVDRQYVTFNTEASGAVNSVPGIRNHYLAPAPSQILGATILRQNIDAETVVQVEVENSSGAFDVHALLEVVDQTQTGTHVLAAPIKVEASRRVRIAVESRSEASGNTLISLYVSSEKLVSSTPVIVTDMTQNSNTTQDMLNRDPSDPSFVISNGSIVIEAYTAV